MIKIFTASVVFAAALVVLLPAADTAREQKLQQGIDLMESKGDLAKATPLFEEAARSSDRAVAARALRYLGQAQERRQGTDKARATYERIVKEFGNQTETAAAAQQRLAALGGVRASGTLAKRRLCADCGDNEADFSPDGHLMLFTDWDSGDLAIRDLSTGQVNRLLAKTGSWDSDEAFAESPVFSPDQRQIAYFWEVGNKEDDHQLRVMQNEPGGKPRVLISRREGATTFCNPIAWFPDGRSLLAIQALKDRTWELVRVSVSDGAVKVLKSLEWRLYRSSRPNLSPDGRYIVYSALAVNPTKYPPVTTDPTDRHIYVLATDGSNEIEIVKTAGISQNPVWAPDGKHILFTSNLTGISGLWSIAVQNGKAAGAASLVSPGIGDITAFGMRSGSYYYLPKQVPTDYVSIAEMKPNGEKPQGAEHSSESFVGTRPTWSPDGKSIAFKRHHSGSTDTYDLVVRSLESGDERTYLTNLGTTGNGAAVWFHDGQRIMTGIGRSDGSRVSYQIDLRTGDFKELLGGVGPRALSLDDKTIYLVRPPQTPNLVSVDLNTGQERPIFTLPAGAMVRVSLSPDGRMLAILQEDPQEPKQRRIARAAVDGSNYQEVFSAPAADLRQGNLEWTKDSRGILFDIRKEGDPVWRIIRVPSEGGMPEFTGFESVDAMQSFELSPDGSHISLSRAKRVEELWTLDNVLSALK